MNETILLQLYVQKGKLITNMEIMQDQLKTINQQIYQLKSLEHQQAQEKKDD